MNELIKKLIKARDCPVYGQRTTDMGECVIYDYHTFSQSDGVQKIRLQITIIAPTSAETLRQEEIIKSTILTLGDSPLTDDILQVAANGGGTLYDDGRQMQHRIIYFDVVKRGVY